MKDSAHALATRLQIGRAYRTEGTGCRFRRNRPDIKGLRINAHDPFTLVVKIQGDWVANCQKKAQQARAIKANQESKKATEAPMEELNDLEVVDYALTQNPEDDDEKPQGKCRWRCHRKLNGQNWLQREENGKRWWKGDECCHISPCGAFDLPGLFPRRCRYCTRRNSSGVRV